ncbi:RNase adapter RapZ, partial [Deinococcus sp. GbtcB9]|uniref:RNase adapter RapZ n=1 Tax=Deinococcus sp. GbtcB9 TaxID=2824754 RepID=UPI0027394F12
TALRTLEDAGYFNTDNLPPELWGAMHDPVHARGLTRVAISTDDRTRDFMGALEDSYVRLSRRPEDLRVLFPEANDDVLLKRYNFTRR